MNKPASESLTPTGEHPRARKNAAPPATADIARLLHELEVYQIELEMQNEALRQARADLEASLAKYADLYDFAPVGYLTLGGDGVIREANLAAAALLGLDRARLPGRPFAFFASEDSRCAWRDFLEQLSASETAVTGEVTLALEGRAPRRVQLHGSRIAPSPSGDWLCRVAILDLTERKQAEEKLRESEAKLSLALRAANLGTWFFNLQTGEFAADTAAKVLHGFHGDEAITTLEQGNRHIHPDDLPEIRRRFDHAVQTKGIYENEYRVVLPEGGLRWIYSLGRVLRDAPYLIGTVQDITARKQAEEALREVHDRLVKTVATSPGIVCSFRLRPDGSACYPFGGERLAEVYGIPHAPLAEDAAPFLALTHPDDLGRLREAIAESARRLSQFHHEWRVRHPSRGEVWIEANSMPQRESDGSILWHGVASDITERKRLEMERAEAFARLALVQEEERHRISRELHDQTAQRLVALAVELKNLELQLAAGQPPGGRVRALRQAVDELQRQVRGIAWNLREPGLAQADLEGALREYVEEWSERAQLAVEWESRGLDGRRLPALVEFTLYRVAQEALVNVQKHARARRVSVLLERDAGVVRLTVEDDGCGFDPEAVPKSVASGPELGFLGMKERVALVGGSLLIESSPGSGTTILVRVPIPTELEPA